MYEMKMSKSSLYSFYSMLIAFPFVLLALGLMILSKNWVFFCASLGFFGMGGIYEFVIMNKFYSKEKKFNKKSIKEKIKYGFLWVHMITDCIKFHGTKLYSSRKIGFLPIITSYAIMSLYILTALILYLNFSYYGLLIYLIPVITNIISFWRNNYYILK